MLLALADKLGPLAAPQLSLGLLEPMSVGVPSESTLAIDALEHRLICVPWVGGDVVDAEADGHDAASAATIAVLSLTCPLPPSSEQPQRLHRHSNLDLGDACASASTRGIQGRSTTRRGGDGSGPRPLATGLPPELPHAAQGKTEEKAKGLPASREATTSGTARATGSASSTGPFLALRPRADSRSSDEAWCEEPSNFRSLKTKLVPSQEDTPHEE